MSYYNYPRTFIFSLGTLITLTTYADVEKKTLCYSQRVQRGWAVVENKYDDICGWDPTFKDNQYTIVDISTLESPIVVCYNTPESSLQGLKLISTHESNACASNQRPRQNTWVFERPKSNTSTPIKPVTPITPTPTIKPAPTAVEVSSLLKVYYAITPDMTLTQINKLTGFDGIKFSTRAAYSWQIRTGTTDFELMRVSFRKDGVVLYDKDFVSMKTGTLRQTLNSLN